ncbi:MAG: signal peptide peptidase SppA [Thermodesulfobacteriota bacterium]
MKSRILAVVTAVLMLAALSGCISPNIKLFSDESDPLAEQILSGKGPEKIAVITVSGMISDEAAEHLLKSRPSMVQEVVAQLALAEKDPDVKAVVIKVNSPGGTVTASDILYHEITRFKEKTKKPVYAAMMDVAASGGYYISLAADRIYAHPTTVTGSVGVLLMRPQVSGLMDKLGLSVVATTSGKNKDMGSPFRPATEEEKAIFQNTADTLADRFLGLTKENRKLSEQSLENVATARIYTADQAKELGLIDGVAYLDGILADLRKEAGLSEDAAVVAYRRSKYADDNIYNQTTMRGPAGDLSAVSPLPGWTRLSAGYYYLWLPGIN